MKSFHKVLDHAEDHIDCILSYNQYTLQIKTLLTKKVDLRKN